MRTIDLRASLRAAIVTVGILLPLTGANAQATCQWYGATALKQQQENEKFRCGFRGSEWHSDLRAHMAWCASVPPDVWKRSAQARDRALSACAAGKK